MDAEDPEVGPPPFAFTVDKPVGQGSFGHVFLVKVNDTGELLALKKVLQDRRFKNRELSIMKMLNHPNVCRLRGYFYSDGESSDDLFLNLLLEYIPETAYRFLRYYTRQREYMPQLYVRLFVYQLARSLAYIASPQLRVCHRDIKPQNLLIDPATGRLALCDFGSAKALNPSEPNVAYICSRYYRAPELIMGQASYTTSIDIWSLGCVFAELLLGGPVFPGESSIDQLIEILKVLGTPSPAEVEEMNPQYVDFSFPDFKPVPWAKFLRASTPPQAVDLLSRILVYRPSQRPAPLEIVAHPYFDPLRDPATKLPSGAALPPLFDFSQEELSQMTPELYEAIVPPHMRASVPPPSTFADAKPSGSGGGSGGQGAVADPSLPVKHS